MPQDRRWFERSHLWRLILTQHDDGHWSLTADVAAAATAQCPPADWEDEADGDPLAFRRGTFICWTSPLTVHGLKQTLSSFARSVETLRGAMPPSLVEACGAAASWAPDADEVWATMVAMVVLEKLDMSWLQDQDKAVTIVDQARMWLEKAATDIWPQSAAVAWLPHVALRSPPPKLAATGVGGAGGLQQSSTSAPPGCGAVWRTRCGAAGDMDGDDAGPPAGAADGGAARTGGARHPLEEVHAAARAVCAHWQELFLQRVTKMRRVEERSLHGFLTTLQASNSNHPPPARHSPKKRRAGTDPPSRSAGGGAAVRGGGGARHLNEA